MISAASARADHAAAMLADDSIHLLTVGGEGAQGGFLIRAHEGL